MATFCRPFGTYKISVYFSSAGRLVPFRYKSPKQVLFTRWVDRKGDLGETGQLRDIVGFDHMPQRRG